MTDPFPTTHLGGAPLRSALLSTVSGVIHGITHRVIGMGLADGNVGDTPPRDMHDAWEMRKTWSARIGVDPERLVRTGQVHGNDVYVVTGADAGCGKNRWTPTCGIADSTITNLPNLPLMTLAADCQPILMIDPERMAIAAIHAGWRSTVADITGETVRTMTATYGTDPADILAFLGPAAGGCCYEVGPEVAQLWRDQARDLGAFAELAITMPGPKEHFDVPRANQLLLQRAGLRPENIEVSPICTMCQSDEWFSHRRQGPGTGRHAGVIMLTEGARS